MAVLALAGKLPFVARPPTAGSDSGERHPNSGGISLAGAFPERLIGDIRRRFQFFKALKPKFRKDHPCRGLARRSRFTGTEPTASVYPCERAGRPGPSARLVVTPMQRHPTNTVASRGRSRAPCLLRKCRTASVFVRT